MRKKDCGKWCVANDLGHLAGHDLDKASAIALADILNAEEPDEGWEAIGGGEDED